MKRFYLLLGLVMTLTFSLSAKERHVKYWSGTIVVSKDSYYATVTSDTTLIILPGTKVYFKKDAGLYVMGK